MNDGGNESGEAMPLWAMMQKMGEWDDNPEPDMLKYLDRYGDAIDVMEKAFTPEEMGAFLGGLGIFAALVRCYGIPSDIDELWSQDEWKV